jgi:hypothetical protein
MSAPPQTPLTDSSLRGPRAMEVLDEAASLLRRTPLPVLSIYYLGALPFCLVLVYFLFDMTQSADAEGHLPGEAFLLTSLYFWMKTCQAVFTRKLLALLEGKDDEPWDLRRWMNTALLQIIYAGSLVIVYPAALFMMIPFGWVSAFYHNISIVATGCRSTVRSSLKEAVELSQLWPRQNHLILAILLAALLFLFINLAVFFSMIPELVNMFLGIETIFGENGSAWQNSSFYLDVFVFCFLILNPLNKAVYALRCFYGRSRLSGADLKAGLRRLSGNSTGRARAFVALVLLSVLSLAVPIRGANASPAAPVVASPAATPAPGPANLDHAIQKTLQKDEFAWRLPREQVKTAGNEGFFARTIHSFYKFLGRISDRIGKFLGKWLDWLFDHQKKHDDSSNSAIAALAAIPWRLIFILILLVVVGFLIFLLVRYFRGRIVLPTPSSTLVPVNTVDLEAENVRADDLPEDSWLALARELIAKGELRLALRALYLATLCVLAQHQLVRLSPGKSNRDYLVELTRRLRGNAPSVQLFRQNIHLFEASWYGTHAVTSEIIDTMLANHQQVRSDATA